jgi:hypothetical protein
MFSVIGAVVVLAVLLALPAAAAAEPDVVCVTLGLIIDFLPMPARRRGLSNR